jgi:hypothetical protein
MKTAKAILQLICLWIAIALVFAAISFSAAIFDEMVASQPNPGAMHERT